MMKKLIELIKTQLLNIPRNRSLLFGLIGFPLIFIGIFGLAMQDGVQYNTTMTIGVIASDNGIPANTVVMGPNSSIIINMDFQSHFLDIVEEITYDDNSTKIFEVKYYQSQKEMKALSDIQTSNINALMIIPEDFSLGILAAIRASFDDNMNMSLMTNNWQNYPETNYQSEVVIRGDPSIQSFSIASSILSSILDEYFKLGKPDIDGHSIMMDTDVAVDDFSVFDYILPGLVIFGLLQNVGLTATLSMRDVERGLLQRLRITKITPFEYTSSLIVSQLVVTVIQIPIFFAVAIVFGFPATPRIFSAYIFALLVSLSVTGIGLMIASFAKNKESAGALATLVAVPMAFLAGSFFVVPDVTLLENVWDGNNLDLFDLLSAKPAIEGIRLILVNGQNFGDVMFQLGLLTFLTFIYLGLGLKLYARKHLTPED